MTRSSLAAGALGAVLAAATWLLSQQLAGARATEFHAILLTLIGSAYIGFAFAERETPQRLAELIGVALFVSLALLGLWLTPWLIVVGLVLHGVWDILHHGHQSALKTSIPHWYAPLCLAYDWLLAVLIALELL